MANRASAISSVDDLRLAIALVDHGSVMAAAASLHIAQPSASHRLRLMERRIGVALFERASTGTRPTQAGVEYVARARDALKLIQVAADDARRAAGVERIRFGTFTSLSVPVFAALDQLLPPESLVDQHINNGGYLVRRIAEGQLDGAVVSIPPGLATPQGTQRIRLGNDPLLLIAPAGVSLPQVGRSQPAFRVQLASYSSQPDDVAEALAGHGAIPCIAGTAPVALAIARRRGEVAAVPRSAWIVDQHPGETSYRLGSSFEATLGLVLARPPMPALAAIAADLANALGLQTVP